MSVLLTGFSSFGDVTSNPSEQVVRQLHGEVIADRSIASAVLPVTTSRVEATLANAIDEAEPSLIVVTGVAPGRSAPALERVAINIRDFPIADIDGDAPVDEPVVRSGPAAYITSLPVKAILKSWTDNDVPGYLSHSAGTYLCNQVFYLACHAAQTRGIRAGLVHLPNTVHSLPADRNPGQEPPATAELGTLTRAVSLAIAVALEHSGADLPVSAGAVS